MHTVYTAIFCSYFWPGNKSSVLSLHIESGAAPGSGCQDVPGTWKPITRLSSQSNQRMFSTPGRAPPYALQCISHKPLQPHSLTPRPWAVMLSSAHFSLRDQLTGYDLYSNLVALCKRPWPSNAIAMDIPSNRVI